MQVTIKPETESEKEWEYPCLMQAEDGEIVLAIRDGGEEHDFVGLSLKNLTDYSVKWNKRTFKLFNGSVTLRND